MTTEQAAAVERLRTWYSGPGREFTDIDAADLCVAVELAVEAADTISALEQHVAALRADAEEMRTMGLHCFELNASQQRQDRHPFTCGNNSRHRNLIATLSGWRCADCDYAQPYGHPAEDFMGNAIDPAAIKRMVQEAYAEAIEQGKRMDEAAQKRVDAAMQQSSDEHAARE